MIHFITWLLIPVLTFLVSGPYDWFTLNFSVIGSEFPQNLLLLGWAMVVGGFYHTFTRYCIGQTAPYLHAKTELAMIDGAVCLLLTAILFPYKPSSLPLISMLHLAMAFSASVIFFLSITIVDLKLLVIAPRLFFLPTVLLLFAILVSIGLLALCNFLITSALEIFLTIFSCFWLKLFHRRIIILVRKKRMAARI